MRGSHHHQRRTGNAVERAAADRVVHGATATVFGGSIERSAEDLVVRRWTRNTTDAAVNQLNEARANVSIPDVDVVIGTGTEWREAVDNIAGESGDMLLLGSGAAGPLAQVFLGSAASKSCATHPSR